MTDEREQRGPVSDEEAGPRQRSRAARLTLLGCAMLFLAGFIALGTWQLYRLQWKLALIQRVNERVHAAPVDAPPPDRWPAINAQSDEYLHVRMTGVFLYPLSVKVRALTAFGSGYWVLTPLRAANGVTVLVNRGFIPEGDAASNAHFAQEIARENRQAGGRTVTVTGLLRMTEPKGGFLRDNDPAHDRWYSRDVQAIAQARGLNETAPFFVDADGAQPGSSASRNGADGLPIGGLTVVSFYNNHLVYALTWYALALMMAGVLVWALREERKLRRGGNPAE